MDEVKSFILMKVPEATRCPDHEVIRQINSSFAFFTVFDSILSNSWTPVGFLEDDKEEKTCKGLAQGLKMW